MDDQVLDEFMVGDALSLSFKTFFANILHFSIIGFFAYLPVFLISLLFLTVDETQPIDISMTTIYSGMGVFLLSLVFSYLAYGAITFGTIRYLQGKPASLGEIISVGFARFFPVLLVAIVTTIATGIGMIFLFVPGIIIAMIVYVALPVAVIERPGIFESLSRSAELTKGYRWKIFGLAIVVLLIYYGFALVIGIFATAGQTVAAIADLIFSSFTIAFGAVVTAVVYQELRRVKEGVDVDTIASVFS